MLAETHAYFTRRRLAEQILDDYEDNPAIISEPVTPEDEKAAIEFLRQNGDKTYSYYDAVFCFDAAKAHRSRLGC